MAALLPAHLFKALLFAMFLVSGFELVNFVNKIPCSRAYVAAQAAVSQRSCVALYAPAAFSAIAELLANLAGFLSNCCVDTTIL